MKNNDKILVDLFGKEVELSILCTGDNQFDEEGDYKEDENFELLPEEVQSFHLLCNPPLHQIGYPLYKVYLIPLLFQTNLQVFCHCFSLYSSSYNIFILNIY